MPNRVRDPRMMNLPPNLEQLLGDRVHLPQNHPMMRVPQFRRTSEFSDAPSDPFSSDYYSSQSSEQPAQPMPAIRHRIMINGQDVTDQVEPIGNFGNGNGPMGHPMGSMLEQLLQRINRPHFSPGDGVSQNTIDHMPTSTYSASNSGNPEQCVVCMDNFSEGDEIRTLVCFHKFHKACIDEWLGRCGVCPVCKESVNANQ